MWVGSVFMTLNFDGMMWKSTSSYG